MLIKEKIILAAKGMSMGIAEVIPGVSGGTIAFITGIYERLINAIKSVGPELFYAWKKGGVKAAWKTLDGNFLVNLLVGMAAGIVVGVFGVGYLLDNYPEPLWGFFFGLIIASCIYIGKMVKTWSLSTIATFLVGTIIAFGITVLAPAEGSDAYPMIFIAGVIAISALILPGISGSFILLIMGMYHIVIPAIKHFLEYRDSKSFMIFLVFALGALLGLTTFSRVVSWLFNKYEKLTLALLTGFMLGSLNKIWPWRNVGQIKLDDRSMVAIHDLNALQDYPSDAYKVLVENNVLPADYWMSSPKVLLTAVALIVGFLTVFILERLGSQNENA